MQIASLELILGRKLYEDGHYVPIEASEFREKLMPGANDDEPDEDEGTPTFK